jgi:hypothetical protein
MMMYIVVAGCEVLSQGTYFCRACTAKVSAAGLHVVSRGMYKND